MVNNRILDSAYSSAEWSDPRDSTETTASSSTPWDESDGITIPAFLRPLLGLDFVPYLPHHHPAETSTSTTTTTTTTATTATGTSSAVSGTEEELEIRLELLVPPPPVTTVQSVDSVLPVLTRSHSDPIMLEALRPPTAAAGCSTTSSDHSFQKESPHVPPEEEPDPPGSSSQNRKSWITRVRGKMDERRVRSRPPTTGTTAATGDKSRRRRKAHRGVATPSTTGTGTNRDASLEWIQEQNVRLVEQQAYLSNVQIEAHTIKTRASDIQQRIGETQKEIHRLHKAMMAAETKLRRDCDDFAQLQKQLLELQKGALVASQAMVDYLQQTQDLDSSEDRSGHDRRSPSQKSDMSSEYSYSACDSYEGAMDVIPATPTAAVPLLSDSPLRPRAATAPAFTSRADSFMRVDDLDILEDVGDEHEYSPSPDVKGKGQPSPKGNGMIFLDNHIVPILEKLTMLGYSLAVDESSRFVPSKDTEKLLGKYSAISVGGEDNNDMGDWPIRPWKAARGNDILIWTGDIGHSGFGSDWPVVKARCLVKTSPRSLIEFMMDSSKTKEYNKMSQGREDLVRIQEGIDTTASESFFGFEGDCKIIKSLNKPRLLPKAIETVSLMYSKPLANAAGSYMTVTRSVFEDNSGEHKASANNTIRTETLIGVLLFRPANKDQSVTEFTSITHVFSPGVPEMLARRAAPGSAYNVLKDIQSVFAKSP